MKTTILMGLLGINTISFSQAIITNQGFENWEQVVVKDSIEHWTTSTQDYQSSGADINNAYQINTAQDGNKAIHVETLFESNGNGVDTLLGFVVQADAQNGFVGFPYSDIVTNLKGWYKCNNIVNDSALVMVIQKSNGVEFSQSIYKFTGIVSSWTQFDLPLNNSGTITPDSIWVGFVSSNFEVENERQEGNWLEIDNVWFENNGNPTTVIPGHSFENLIQETIEQPTAWWSFDKFLYHFDNSNQYVTKSTDAIEGVSSMRVEKTQISQDAGIMPFVTNGIIDYQVGFIGGAPFNAQPATYSFQYKYIPSGLDTAYALVNLNNNGTTLNINDSVAQLIPAVNWTTKTFNFSLLQAPDSIRITFFPGDSVGSVLMIDDIQFLGGDVSIDEMASINNLTVYPNPANAELTLKNVENTVVSIFDISGKNVYESANHNDLIRIETSTWNTGVYFIKIQNSVAMDIKKIVIRH